MNGFETGAEYQLPGLANLTPNLPVNLRIEKWNSLWPAFGLWCPVMGVLWFYSAVQSVYICPVFLRDASLPCPSHPGPQVEGEEVEITGKVLPSFFRETSGFEVLIQTCGRLDQLIWKNHYFPIIQSLFPIIFQILAQVFVFLGYVVGGPVSPRSSPLVFGSLGIHRIIPSEDL